MSAAHSIPAQDPAGSAFVESDRIGPGCKLAALSRVMAEAVLEADCQVGARALVAQGVWLGRGVSIGHGAVVGERSHVSPGVRIGNGAQVEPGSVVEFDIPPHAKVSGQPAHVIGFEGARMLAWRAAGPSVALPDFGVAGAALHRLPRISDSRGHLSFGQVGSHLPFDPRRFFVIDGVPQGHARGDHAHRALHQFLICLRGSCVALVDDGRVREEVMLDTPEVGLHMRPMVWGTQYRYSSDALLLVLASDVYHESDYLRDYDTFLALMKPAPATNTPGGHVSDEYR